MLAHHHRQRSIFVLRTFLPPTPGDRCTTPPFLAAESIRLLLLAWPALAPPDTQYLLPSLPRSPTGGGWPENYFQFNSSRPAKNPPSPLATVRTLLLGDIVGYSCCWCKRFRGLLLRSQTAFVISHKLLVVPLLINCLNRSSTVSANIIQPNHLLNVDQD